MVWYVFVLGGKNLYDQQRHTPSTPPPPHLSYTTYVGYPLPGLSARGAWAAYLQDGYVFSILMFFPQLNIFLTTVLFEVQRFSPFNPLHYALKSVKCLI
jgi:hypothetical protein